MSTIKSSAEDLTLNADGSGNDIKFQSNGVEKASLTDGGVFTATSFAGSGANLTGLPASGLPLTGGTMTGALDLNHSINVSHNSGVAAIIANSAASQLALRLDQTNASEPYGMVIDFSAVAKNNTTNYFILCEDSDAAKFKVFSSGQVQTPSILFGTDTAAANALNDYEEGTWTPALASTTTSCSMGTVHTSHYTKIGNVVKLYTSFEIDSSANPATGNLRFTGFPFALKTLGEGALLISIYYNYKAAPMAFMSKSGYTYYSNAVVDGNNLGPLVETIGQNTTNVMGMQFSYLTDA